MPDHSSDPQTPGGNEQTPEQPVSGMRDLFAGVAPAGGSEPAAPAQRDLFGSAQVVGAPAPGAGDAPDRADAEAEREAAQKRARDAHKNSTRTWRDGSATARAWNTTVLAYAAVSAGLGIIGYVAARAYLPPAQADLVASLVLWAGLLVPIIIALVRSVPRGLFRFRWTDLIWGLGLGLILRLVQGWLEVAAGSSGALPQYATLDGQLPAMWFLLGLLGPVLIAPLLEETLFRGVVLVSVYRLARRGLEGALLGAVASTALFVAIHAVSGIGRWDTVVVLALVGGVASALVLLTGRIWGAILLHMTFNGLYVLLALAGTFIG